MRTTLNIDDDVLRAARSLATAQGKSVGEVLSALARKGLTPEHSWEEEDGIPTFRVSVNSSPVTPELVREALDDGW